MPIVCAIPDRIMDALDGRSPAGVLLALWREGTYQKSWVGFEVLEESVKDPPPPGFDVVPILLRLWGLQDRQRSLDRQAKEATWKADLDELVATDAPPAPPAPPTSPVPLPPPTRPAPTGSAEPLLSPQEIRARLAKARGPAGQVVEQPEEDKPAVLPFKAGGAPPAEGPKKARKRKKGGA
jgi:hypothetical protein